jgi:hypothetical protein
MQKVMEETFWLAMLAFIVVGTPALILKLTMIWFVQSDGTKPRLRLLALSIGGCSLAGIVAIACYAALSQLLEFPAPGAQFVPRPFVFLATAALLVGLVAVSESALWQRLALRQGVQSIRTKAAWLFAGNAWVLWAVWLMTQYREMQVMSAAD